VAPIEFTLPAALYERLGGHVGDAVSIAEILTSVAPDARIETWREDNPWPFEPGPFKPGPFEPGTGAKR
jgi:hypothetical protein